MVLNYSKWDRLELSDDSDIEGHPNVDKKSLVRALQRNIHEKREIRKENIQRLSAQIACNQVLLPRVKEIETTLNDPSSSAPAAAYFNSLVEKLQSNPSRDCPPGNDPKKLEQTYDGMLLTLLKMVGEESKKKVKESGVLEAEKDARLAKELAAELSLHVKHLGDTIAKDKKALEDEEIEQRKHITSDDMHEGFDSKYIPPTPAPPPVPHTKIDKKKAKVTEIEVLNPAASSSSSAPPPEDDDTDDEGLPEMTPSLEAFSKIPIGAFDKSFEFIQHHRDVYVPGASDSLLVAAFTAQGVGKTKYAKQCVHQSLLLQYCEKLGRDGVGIFFKKMINGDKRALKVFVDDVESTHKHLIERVRINQEESAKEGREQIQLVPENPSQSISFNVPDGPPPENLVLEGPGTEGMDIEEVRKALQLQWDVFQSFPTELQQALKSGGLDGVNKVLGDMEVPVAEAIVNSLDVAGILSFADGGIRDETGKAS
ncbi:hsp90-like protein [Crassisporium funariophilum]|nr:hsp90-like protein [Crassisporium funariophilum]